MKVEQNSHEPSNYRASTNPALGISSVAGTRQPAGLPRGRLVCRRRPTSAVGPIEASFLFHLYGTDALLIRLRCRGDLNLHTLTGWVHAPQACASANSATTAKSTASLQTNSNPLPQAITAAHVGLSPQLASEFIPPNRGRPLRPGPFVSARVRPTCNERIRHAGKRCGAQGDFLSGSCGAVRFGPNPEAFGYALRTFHVAQIRSDYQDMREMFFAEAPPFDTVMADLRELEDRVNRLFRL